MDKNFKLTIITVCRNEPNIERTCKSIVSQTWQDFEWIVVDGASTDGTLEILEKYKDRIDIFVSEPDTGIYNAMNKGIHLSHGEFLNFMNGGDEFFDKNVLKKVFKEDISYAKDDVLYGNSIYIYPNGTIQLAAFPEHIDIDYCFGFRWGVRWCLSHQSSFIRRSIFGQKGYDESLKLASDYKGWIYWLKEKRKFRFLNTVCSKFYMNGAGVQNPTKTMTEVQAAIESVFTQKELKKIYARQRTKRRWTILNGIEVFRESINAERSMRKFFLFGIPVFSSFQKKEFQKTNFPSNNALGGLIQKLKGAQNHLWRGVSERIEHARSVALPASTLHREVFSKYRNLHAGEEIVIVGAGPTLDDYTPIPNAIHIGVNKTFLCEKLKLDYLFIQDRFEDIQDAADEYRTGECKKFYGYHPHPLVRGVPAASEKRAHAERYFFEDLPANDPSPFPFPPDISRAPLGTFSSVIFPALQFALWTHPKRIYLVGFDCSSLGHCSGITSKTSAGTKFPLATERLLYGWQKMKDFVEKFYPDVEIVSVNPVGLKGMFTDMEQKSGRLRLFGMEGA